MSSAVFPNFQGLTYSIVKAPQWNTAQTRTPTGKTIRIARQAMPTWNFSLKFSYLNRKQFYPFAAMVPVTASLLQVSPTLIADDFAALAGFVNAQQGAYNSWLFEDSRDEAVAQAQVGIGDSTSVNFQLSRQMGAFSENLQNINGTPVAAATWQPNTLVATGALVLPTTSAIRLQQNPISAAWQSSGWPTYFQCTSAGRTGLVEPKWRQTAPLTGMALTDNTAVWNCMGAPLVIYLEQALPDWSAGSTTLNEAISPLSGNAGGFTFICTTAGSGGSEPAWPQSLGGIVSDGGGGIWTNYGVSPAGVSNPIVLQLPSAYSLGATGIVTFGTAPANLAAIFATFSFWFRCHFTEDTEQFEWIMSQYASLGKLDFESLIT